ncbi:MAG: GDSL-type esterase/lipase family protein [Actinomycetota bacterium]
MQKSATFVDVGDIGRTARRRLELAPVGIGVFLAASGAGVTVLYYAATGRILGWSGLDRFVVPVPGSLWTALVGAVLISLGLAALHFSILKRWHRRRKRRILGLGLAGAVIIALTSWLVTGPVVLLVGLYSLGFGCAIVAAVVADDLVEAGGDPRDWQVPAAAGTGVMVAALVGGRVIGENGRLVYSALLWLAGFALFKLGLPGALGDRSNRGLLGAGLALGFGGVALIRFGEPFWMAVGLSLLVIGATFFVEWHIRTSHRTEREPKRAVVLGVVAVALLIVGRTLVGDDLGEWQALQSLVVAVVFSVGAFFLFRGEAVFALIVLGSILTWTSVDRSNVDEAWRRSPPIEGGVVVALGDSFTAGQGAGRFFTDNNNLKEPDASSCRRSDVAYVDDLAASFDLTALNLACSGAVALNLHQTPQHGPPDGAAGGGSTPEAQGGRPFPGELHQLAELQHHLDDGLLTRDQIELIVLSIGGNDVGFSRAAAACMLPSTCDELDVLVDMATELGNPDSDLDAAFAALSTWAATDDDGDATGTGTGAESAIPVVIVPYPRIDIVGEDPEGGLRCDLALSGQELAFITDYQEALNRSLYRTAERHRLAIATTVYDDFPLDRMLCGDDRPGINFLKLVPHEGPLSVRLNPARWKDATAHPNADGHDAIAALLDGWIGEAGSGDLSALARVANTPFAACADGDGCDPAVDSHGPVARDLDERRAIVNEWIDGEAESAGRELAPTMAILFVAGVAAASAVYALYTPTGPIAPWFSWFFPESPKPRSVSRRQRDR